MSNFISGFITFSKLFIQVLSVLPWWVWLLLILTIISEELGRRKRRKRRINEMAEAIRQAKDKV